MSATPQPGSAGISKTVKQLGMPWEKSYGYAQGVRVGDTIYLSGQLSHDEQGNIVGAGDMEAQMRQAYANVGKMLAQYGATMANIVDEILFVVDMDTAMAARSKLKHEIYGSRLELASTIVQIARLAKPEFMIEIRCTARL